MINTTGLTHPALDKITRITPIIYVLWMRAAQPDRAQMSLFGGGMNGDAAAEGPCQVTWPPTVAQNPSTKGSSRSRDSARPQRGSGGTAVNCTTSARRQGNGTSTLVCWASATPYGKRAAISSGPAPLADRVTQAIFGLIGVIVGGVLTGASTTCVSGTVSGSGCRARRGGDRRRDGLKSCGCTPYRYSTKARAQLVTVDGSGA
jgi:hypothetical protein